MMVYGMDFTSVPRSSKPITWARCFLEEGCLRVESFNDLASFDDFERALREQELWIAGIDFPFGQSRKLVTNMKWPMSWSGYVEMLGGLTKTQFVEMLESYKEDRVVGDKEHRRQTDVAAGAISPQKLYGVPVGKMFYEGAKRLLHSPASIVPVRPASDNRVIVEAYPALVARRWSGGSGYKSDTKSKQSEEHKLARKRIVDGLMSEQFHEIYGYMLRLSKSDKDRMVNDPTGDQLDAVLCAVQAAWAWSRHDEGYGVPKDVDKLEGWITDPALVAV